MELRSKEVERIAKDRKKELLERLKRASSEEYETSWDDEGRIGKQKKKTEMKKGKKSKSKGLNFEARVRKDLEEKGWIVAKWTNNVEFEDAEDAI